MTTDHDADQAICTMTLLDPNRKNRTHVLNVRMHRDGTFFVRLSDDSDISWAYWINGGCQRLRRTSP